MKVFCSLFCAVGLLLVHHKIVFTSITLESNLLKPISKKILLFRLEKIGYLLSAASQNAFYQIMLKL